MPFCLYQFGWRGVFGNAIKSLRKVVLDEHIAFLVLDVLWMCVHAKVCVKVLQYLLLILGTCFTSFSVFPHGAFFILSGLVLQRGPKGWQAYL